jgi:alpha-methylacyl-CoA racemase
MIPAGPRTGCRPDEERRMGPLHGTRVVELGGIGPGPHAGMLLADMGADVVRIDRPGGGLQVVEPSRDVLLRGRRTIAADLRDADDLAAVLALLDRADVLIDGFRPGVTDRLGLGVDALAARNPRLVYARMTGWGETGPLSQRAGHDLNYVGLTGVLHAVRPAPDADPTVPLNVVGDFGGGSLYLVVGILGALLERERSGEGQAVDAAIVDGVASLAQMVWSWRGAGVWRDEPAANLLDGAAPFYDTYACSDGRHVAVGSLEPQFYALLLEGLGLADADLPPQLDVRGWPVLRERFTEAFATRTRDEWAAVFADTDACVTPVLTFAEAAAHPHLVERGTLPTVDGVTQAAPAPRFSRSATPVPGPAAPSDAAAVLASWDA